MSELRKPRGGITECGLKNLQVLSCTLESQVRSSKAPLIDKKNCSNQSTQKVNLSLILPADLTKIDVGISEFWNEQSTVLHSMLWQPHQIESQGRDSSLLDGSLNYQVGVSSFWKSQILPINLTQKHSLPLLPALSIPTTESETESVISRKIRIYPKHEALWEQALNIYRRAYNLTIELFKPKYSKRLDLKLEGQKPSSELRAMVVDWCKHEATYNGVGYDVNLLQSAYRKACDTRAAVIKKRMKKEKAGYTFMSRMEAAQYFVSPRLSQSKMIFPRLLGDFHWSEPCPDSSVGKTVIVTRVNDQWFASVKAVVETAKVKQGNLKIVALDPGVRTFQTAFSVNDAIDYGANFQKERLAPLMVELDALLSKRDLLANEQDQSKQWINDRRVNLTKRIHNLRAKQRNLVEDLHRRVAHDLVTNYDLILLPTFETKQMTQKSNETRKRFLRRKTVRGMLGLAHYKFKQIVKWMAKKYGKTVVDVNESYTSKTLWDGSILKNLGGKSSISFQGKKVNRDHQGSRNIFLRFLTKVLDVVRLREAHSLIITNGTEFKQNFSTFGGLK